MINPELLDNITKLGYSSMFTPVTSGKEKYIELCLVHNWLIKKDIIVLVHVSITSMSKLFNYRVVDSSKGTYNELYFNTYEFPDYKIALENGISYAVKSLLIKEHEKSTSTSN